MTCPICDRKASWCECTAKERELFEENEDLENAMETLANQFRACVPVPRELAHRILSYMYQANDEGPVYAPWKSDQLKDDIKAVSALLSQE